MRKSKIQAIKNPVQKLVMPDKHMYYWMYHGNSDIQACVSEISKRSGVNWMYFDQEWVEITNKYLESIEIMFQDHLFKLRIVRDLFIGGEVYLSPRMDARSSTVWFNFHDPRTMAKKHDRYWNIEQYTQSVGWYIQNFKTDEMYYIIREPDIDNEVNWLSKLSGLALDVLSDSSANLYNYRFFQNGMSKDIIVNVEDGISQEEWSNIKEQFTADNTWDNDTARWVIVTNGIKEIIPISWNNKEAQFMDLRRLTTEKVCSAFGVPKSVLSYTDWVNYATASSQYKSYIDSTIRPTEALIEKIINDLIFKFVDTSLYANNIVLKLNGDNYQDTFAIHEDQRADLSAWILTVEEIKLLRGNS